MISGVFIAVETKNEPLVSLMMRHGDEKAFLDSSGKALSCHGFVLSKLYNAIYRSSASMIQVCVIYNKSGRIGRS